MDRRYFAITIAALAAGCASTPSPAPQVYDPAIGDFAQWSANRTDYTIFPGDEIELAFPSAQELNRQVIVAPDGRISLPLVGHVMAADLTISQLEATLSAAYAPELLRPAVEATIRRPGPMKIWVDGQVANPGMFDLPSGDSDAYQALVMAGGVLPSARAKKAVVIRKSATGQRMMTVVDLRPRASGGPTIQRGDIIFVPRSTLGELTTFFTQVRETLPIGFSYALNGRWN